MFRKLLVPLLILWNSNAAIAQQQPAGPLTDERIIELVRSGIHEDELERIIATAPDVNFNLTPAAEQQMMQAGVTVEAIKAMAARESGTGIQPQGQPANPQIYSPVPPAPAANSGTPATSDEYIHKGSKEIGLFGTVFIPHIDTSQTSGFASTSVGYYIARSSVIGVDFDVQAQNGLQIYVPLGFYRFVAHTANPRLFPFVGAAAGGAIEHASGLGTAKQFAAVGEAGIKYFVARHASFDIAYNLLYVHVSGATFKQSTESLSVFGFSLTF